MQQRTDATGAAPEREAEANPSPESSEEDRDSTGSVPDKMVDVTVVPVHRPTSWKGWLRSHSCSLYRQRSEIGRVTLDKTFEERDTLSQAIVTIVNEAARA